jgi:hypothetical protein
MSYVARKCQWVNVRVGEGDKCPREESGLLPFLIPETAEYHDTFDLSLSLSAILFSAVAYIAIDYCDTFSQYR